MYTYTYKFDPNKCVNLVLPFILNITTIRYLVDDELDISQLEKLMC